MVSPASSRMERIALDAGAHSSGGVGQLAVGETADGGLSAGWRGQAEQDLHRCGLTRTVWAEKTRHPSGIDNERQVVDDGGPAVALGDVFDGNGVRPSFGPGCLVGYLLHGAPPLILAVARPIGGCNAVVTVPICVTVSTYAVGLGMSPARRVDQASTRGGKAPKNRRSKRAFHGPRVTGPGSADPGVVPSVADVLFAGFDEPAFV